MCVIMKPKKYVKTEKAILSDRRHRDGRFLRVDNSFLIRYNNYCNYGGFSGRY